MAELGIVPDRKKKILCTFDSLFIKEANIIKNTILSNYEKFKSFLDIEPFTLMDMGKIMISLIERPEKNIVTWLGSNQPETLGAFEKLTPFLYIDAPLTDIMGTIRLLSFNKVSIDSVTVISDIKSEDIEAASNIVFTETNIQFKYVDNIIEYVKTSDFDVFIDNDLDTILQIVSSGKITEKTFIVSKYAYNFRDFNTMILKNGMTIEDFYIAYGSELGLMLPVEYGEDDKDYG